MWRGNILIGNGRADVEAHEINSGGFKEWQGQGKLTGNTFIDIGEFQTELGVIIVNHLDSLSGYFTFVGSGKPFVEL